MRIAVGMSEFPSLSQIFVLNQIQSLIESERNFDIYSFSRPEEDIVHQKVTDYEMESYCRYISQPNSYLTGIQQVARTFKNQPNLLPLLVRLGYNRDARAIGCLNTMISNGNKYDRYHVHFGTTARHWGPLKEANEALASTPLIVSFYGYDATSRPKANPGYYDEFRDKFDCIVTVCEGMKPDLTRWGFKEQKMTTVPLGVDTEYFSYSFEEPSEAHTDALLVARFVEKKGVKYALEAVDSIHEEVDISLRLIGDGPLRDDIEQIIEKRNLGDIVEISGYQPLSEIKAALHDADVLLAPCITPESGDKSHTPAIILQSQAAGTPVISTYHSGIPEIVDDGQTVLLVDQRDGEAMGSKVTYLLDNPEMYAEIAKDAREYVEREHSIDALSTRLQNLYQRYDNPPKKIPLSDT